MTHFAKKYGLPGNHEPRCNCSDCNAMFLEHNRAGTCRCKDCVSHREINGAPPRTTTAEEYAQNIMRSRTTHQKAYRTPASPPIRKGSTVGNLNVCEREGCNAIIKGDAAAFMTLAINGKTPADESALCPACVAEIDTLMHTAPVSERQRAYDKPYTGYRAPSVDSLNEMTTEQLAAELFQRTMREAQKTLESGKEQ